MASSLSRTLTKALMPIRIIVTVCTVGGVDENGNDMYEPVVFDGGYPDAAKFFQDENNIIAVQNALYKMPDGYIVVEVGSYSTQVYDAMEIMDMIEIMI